MWWIIGAVLLIFGVLLLVSNNCLEATTHYLTSEKIDETFNNYKILQLSDLHNKNYNERIGKQARIFKPDVIILSGDMISANSKVLSGFENCLKSILGIAPIYYVKGNHELVLKNDAEIELNKLLTKYGVIHLSDTTVKLYKEDKYITLSGTDLKKENYQSSKRKDAKMKYKPLDNSDIFKIDRNNYNMLIAHNPNYFDIYKSWSFDLVLSGHVHGGLVRLPFIGGLFSSELRLFPKYQSGAYIENKSVMIVSRGLGGNIPLRFNNKLEIVQIILKSK